MGWKEKLVGKIDEKKKNDSSNISQYLNNLMVLLTTSSIEDLEEIKRFMKKHSASLKTVEFEWFLQSLVASPNENQIIEFLKLGFNYFSQSPTLILLASRARNYKIVLFLLENDIDPCYQSSSNRNGLYYIARGIHSSEDCEAFNKYLSFIPKSNLSTFLNHFVSENSQTIVDITVCDSCRSSLKKLGAKEGEQVVFEYYETRFNSLNRKELLSLGKTLKQRNLVPKYPMIIIPGTCSSKLEVWKSDIWERGTLLWTSPSKMGFSGTNFLFRKFGSDKIPFVEHMKLADDGKSDPPGIIVRNVRGLSGCDYLCNRGAVRDTEISGKSYREASVVHGNFIRVLVDLGYSDKNLTAFTYDWRLAPFYLNERENVMLKLKYEIEYMKISNNEKVLLTGHSQGGKFIHYFLLWAEDHFGRSWIDDNIEGVIGLGIPWLGAPKAIRGLVSGDNMGLPTLFVLGDGYMLGMTRTYSSVPWLFPLSHHENSSYLRENKNEKTNDLDPLHRDQILEKAEIHKSLQYWKDYLDDPYFGKIVDGEMVGIRPPPVSKIYNIYGVDQDTEIGAYYITNKNPIVIGGESAKYTVDTSVNIDRSEEGYFVRNGIIFETPAANKHSGDKTVPYESLSYPKQWVNYSNAPIIKTYEFKLSGSNVQHRSMMSEPVILELIAEIACGNKIPDKILDNRQSVYELEWSQLAVDENNVSVFLKACFNILNSFDVCYDIFTGNNRIQSEIFDLGMLVPECMKYSQTKQFTPPSVAWAIEKLFFDQKTPYFTANELIEILFFVDLDMNNDNAFDEGGFVTSVKKIFDSFHSTKKYSGIALFQFLNHYISRDPIANKIDSVSSIFASKLTFNEQNYDEDDADEMSEIDLRVRTEVSVNMITSNEIPLTEKSKVIKLLIEKSALLK